MPQVTADYVFGHIDRRWKECWIGAMILLGVVACAGGVAMPELPPPAGAERFAEDRNFGPLVDLAEVDLLRDLHRTFGEIETQRWKVPPARPFEDLLAHYRERLGVEWKEDLRLAGPGNTNRRVLFIRERKVVALVYVAPPSADTAILIVARSTR